MNKRNRIVMLGGGSVNWSPKLINDLLLTPELHDAEYVILDKDPVAGEKIAQLGKKLTSERGCSSNFVYTSSQKDAFIGADFIIITITTGDLEAMEYDIKIPEDYGIYQTVGDTVGPGGWARGLRNIPVFEKIADDVLRYCPNTVVLNYTNPMSTLTNVFYKKGCRKTVGLCHGVFELYEAFKSFFNVEQESEIKLRFGGVNHFFWLLDFKIRGEDGYTLLKKKMKNEGKSFAQLVTGAYEEGHNYYRNAMVCSELFDTYGYLPYTADRHICEFLSPYAASGTGYGNLEKYSLERTSIDKRRENKRSGMKLLDAYLSGEQNLPAERSRETAVDIIGAIVEKREFIDVVNLPNSGQIANLPMGSIVETLGVVNSLGFTPLTAGELPEPILNLVLPHARNQDMIVQAGLTGNLDMAFYALYNDPLCKHLTIPEIKEMGMRLLEAHRQYLPIFF